MGTGNEKVVLNAVLDSDLEGVLRKIGSYETIRVGKMTCHFCYGPVGLDNMSALATGPKGYVYACGDFGCYREAISHRRAD